MIKTMVLGYAPKAIAGLREQAIAVRLDRDHALRAKVGTRLQENQIGWAWQGK